MNHALRNCGLAIVAGLSLVTPRAALAASVPFTLIEFSGAMETHPHDINAAGAIVGSYRLYDGGGFHGFVYSGGVFTTLDAPGAADTRLYGINDTGQIVGAYGDGHGAQAFLYSDGAFSDLSFSGALYSVANDINNAGAIVGTYNTGTETPIFLTGTGGGATTFQTPGSASTWVSGLNDAGEFVGYDGGSFSFLHNAAGFEVLEVPGALGTYVQGINNSGAIVGYSAQAGNLNGFLLSGGVYRAFDIYLEEGLKFTVTTGINDTGHVVGYFHDYSTGQERGFLLSPNFLASDAAVPEPSTWIMMIVGMGAAGFVLRRRLPRKA